MSLQAQDTRLPAQQQVPKNGIHKSQSSGQNLPALTHGKPQGRGVLILLLLRMQPPFLSTLKRHLSPTDISYPDPSVRFMNLQLFTHKQKKEEKGRKDHSFLLYAWLWKDAAPSHIPDLRARHSRAEVNQCFQVPSLSEET